MDGQRRQRETYNVHAQRVVHQIFEPILWEYFYNPTLDLLVLYPYDYHHWREPEIIFQHCYLTYFGSFSNFRNFLHGIFKNFRSAGALLYCAFEVNSDFNLW